MNSKEKAPVTAGANGDGLGAHHPPLGAQIVPKPTTTCQVNFVTHGDIKARLDVAEVISEYLPLDRHLKAHCPFHSDKNKSFSVHPGKGFWHCFGCGAGGDAFTYIEKFLNLSKGEAFRLLAERAGFDLSNNPESKKKMLLERRRRERLNGAAQRFDTWRESLIDRAADILREIDRLHDPTVTPQEVESILEDLGDFKPGDYGRLEKTWDELRGDDFDKQLEMFKRVGEI